MHLLGGSLVKASLFLIIWGNQVGHGFALKSSIIQIELMLNL